MMKKCTKSSLLLIIFAIATIMGFITFEKGNTNSNDVIYLSPSGDTTGVTDADNIEDALLTVAAGGTVVLTEGHFYTSRSLTIYNFHGTLKGQGKDDTIIEIVRSGPDEGQGFEPAWDPFYLTYIPCMLYFISLDGDLKISDLTAQVIDPSPCESWSIPWDPRETTAVANFFWISDNAFNTELKNLRMKGAPVDNYYGYNMLWSCGMDFSEGDGRTHVVKECDFKNVYTALECWEMTGISIIKIKQNTFSTINFAIVVGNFETTNSMNAIISENTLSHVDYGGIWIGATNNHRIKENDISDCGVYGIVLAWGSSNNHIIDNEIEDCGVFGIGLRYDSSNNCIIENDVEDSGEYDLFWDGTGEGNLWQENEYETANF